MGATGRAETHGHHVSLTAKSLLALGPLPSSTSRLEVTTRGVRRPEHYVTAPLCIKSLYELSVEFSLLVELDDWGVEEDEDEEEDEVKFIPESSGGFVAVFCPLKLFLQTGQVSCWGKKRNKTPMLRHHF